MTITPSKIACWPASACKTLASMPLCVAIMTMTFDATPVYRAYAAFEAAPLQAASALPSAVLHSID
jgi:hypothetical protein